MTMQMFVYLNNLNDAHFERLIKSVFSKMANSYWFQSNVIWKGPNAQTEAAVEVELSMLTY